VPVYVRDTSDAKKQGYRPTATIASERDKALATMRDEFQRIAGLMRRSKDIATYLDLEAEFEAALASVEIFINLVQRQQAVA
jgi:hypothetical protein